MMLQGGTNMNVNTWADGFGNWHALVTEQGVGDAKAARRKARRAIAEEIAHRSPRGFDLRGLTVKPVSKSSRDGELMTEFVEEWSE